MAQRRFFVNKQDINNDIVTISDQEHNHLKNVLRLKVGEEIIVVCNDQYDYYANIQEIAKNRTICKITKKEINANNPKVNVTVYQAITKNNAMSNLVQKLTELGVSNFVPLITKNITAKEGKVEKLQIVANQSIKQCKRSMAMQVQKTTTFKELLLQIKNYNLVIFANEMEESTTIKNIFNENKNYNNIAIIIGSEGGFTADEAQQLVKAGAKSVALGKRILRVETACIATCSIVMYELNELN